ncbi:MAG: DNA polymerase III subunit alpha, partial [Flavobacteriales bacterium]
NKPKISFTEAYKETPDLKKIRSGDDLQARTLQMAEKLEGSVRNVGIHAAGVIIAPGDLTDYIPVCTTKDAELQVTQFEGKLIEEAGMLKMDFLGLKTLSIVADACELVKQNHGVEIVPDEIDLDDQKTYELFQRGETVGTFQFESDGMRAYLKELKPNCIEDLIAMAALYRPGPMQFIEDFIQRKHGIKEVAYPHELLEPVLKETYGIMVYQEQIMKTAQIIANYSLGEADILRRIMGKKKTELLPAEESKFISKAEENGIDKTKAKQVFDMMAKFAHYGFNKSHSAAYSVLAYQTGYLKANYPAEFMAAVLTNNMNDIKKVTVFMEECIRMGIKVLRPDVNESRHKFIVNSQGAIRFGMGAVKGVGEGAVEAIVNERDKNGHFENIFDLARRIDLRAANKKCLESLAKAGAFDCFAGAHRAQYFFRKEDAAPNIIEQAIQHGNKYKDMVLSNQQSLFAGNDQFAQLPEPEMPDCPQWEKLHMLGLEREVTGIYLSGHPLNDYELEIKHFCSTRIEHLQDLGKLNGKKFTFPAIVADAQHKTDKNGRRYAQVILDGHYDSLKFMLFKDDYLKFHKYLVKGWFIYVEAFVKPHYKEENRYELKISNMELLPELREKKAKSITINFPLSHASEHSVDLLTDIARKSPGNCKLKVMLNDREEN